MFFRMMLNKFTFPKLDKNNISGVLVSIGWLLSEQFFFKANENG